MITYTKNPMESGKKNLPEISCFLGGQVRKRERGITYGQEKLRKMTGMFVILIVVIVS